MSGIEIPVLRNDEPSLKARMSENAYEKILPARYLEKNEDGEVVEEQEELFERVAKNIAVAEAVHTDDDLEHIPIDCLHEHFDESDIGYETASGTYPLNEKTARYFSYDKLMDELDEVEHSETIRAMKHWKGEFQENLEKLKMMANTPCLINAGRELQMLSACFVIEPKDDMDDIHDTAKEASQVFKAGGGLGYPFSYLRPYGDVVGSTGGVSSGPLSFMRTFDTVCSTVAQGGIRRGAQMGVMHSWHPDLPFFIHAKNTDVSLAQTLLLNDPDDITHNSFGEAIEEARELIDEDGRVPEHLRNAAEGHLSNFNISVAVDDDFMDALQNDEEYVMINPRTEEPHIATEKTEELYSWFDMDGYVEVGEVLSIPAGELWDRMVEGAYENGEPGVIYIDRVNEHNTFDIEQYPEHIIKATNPCGEEPLEDGDACNLNHINLSTIVDGDMEPWPSYEVNSEKELVSEDEISRFLEQAIEWKELNKRIEVGTRFLDNVVTMSDFPVDKIDTVVEKQRKIGLGIMGLAQLFIQLGVEYGSEESNEIARQLMKHIHHSTKDVSCELAEERGNFDNWDESKWANPTKFPDFFNHHTGLNAEDWEDGYPQRNHETTTIAPTGTTSRLADTTGGCEPIYNVAFFKNVTDDIQGDEMLVVFDSLFIKTLEENDIDVDEVKSEAKQLMNDNEFDGPASLSTVPEEISKLFVTTGDLSAKEHASVQCSLQEGVGSGISKTTNAPSDATVEDAKETFEYIYENGGKSVTYYRDGSRTKQVNTTRKDNTDVDGGTESEEVRRERPKRVDAQIERMNTGLGSLYVAISEDEDGPLEVFANLDKSGSTMQASTEAIGKLASVGLQYGVPPEEIVDQLSGIRGPNVAWDEEDTIESIPDAIGTAFKRYLEGEDDMIGMNHPTTKVEEDDSEDIEDGEVCPDCGEMMAIEEGCAKCYNCGYSRC